MNKKPNIFICDESESCIFSRNLKSFKLLKCHTLIHVKISASLDFLDPVKKVLPFHCKNWTSLNSCISEQIPS